MNTALMKITRCNSHSEVLRCQVGEQPVPMMSPFGVKPGMSQSRLATNLAFRWSIPDSRFSCLVQLTGVVLHFFPKRRTSVFFIFCQLRYRSGRENVTHRNASGSKVRRPNPFGTWGIPPPETSKPVQTGNTGMNRGYSFQEIMGNDKSGHDS